MTLEPALKFGAPSNFSTNFTIDDSRPALAGRRSSLSYVSYWDAPRRQQNQDRLPHRPAHDEGAARYAPGSPIFPRTWDWRAKDDGSDQLCRSAVAPRRSADGAVGFGVHCGWHANEVPSVSILAEPLIQKRLRLASSLRPLRHCADSARSYGPFATGNDDRSCARRGLYR